jgi:hypothetical protein
LRPDPRVHISSGLVPSEDRLLYTNLLPGITGSYNTATGTLTLSGAFKRAGWRAVVDDPVNKRTWPEGSSFYHYDKIYDRRNVGYRGPGFGLPPMPDQYVLSSLHRLELARHHRPALFAEVERAKADGRWDSAYDSSATAKVPDDLAKSLAKSSKAKKFFDSLTSTNRYAILYRLQEAKKTETRVRRLAKFVEMLNKGQFDAKSLATTVVPIERMLEAYQEVVDRTTVTSPRCTCLRPSSRSG